MTEKLMKEVEKRPAAAKQRVLQQGDTEARSSIFVVDRSLACQPHPRAWRLRSSGLKSVPRLDRYAESRIDRAWLGVRSSRRC